MIETYGAFCLREPWLELILLGIKTLESRTRPLFKKVGRYVLSSSQQLDEEAWSDPKVGGRLGVEARKRAMDGRGKLRGYVEMGGFRPGVSGQDDERALISIVLDDGRMRHVSEVYKVWRLVETPTVRVRPSGEVVPGSGQGIFRVPRERVVIAA